MNTLTNLYNNIYGNLECTWSDDFEDTFEAMVELNNRITANLTEATRILEEEPIKENNNNDEKVETKMNNIRTNVITIEQTKEFVDVLIQLMSAHNKAYTNDYSTSHEVVYKQIEERMNLVNDSIFGDNEELKSEVLCGGIGAIKKLFGQDLFNKEVIHAEYCALDKKITVNVLHEGKKITLENYANQLVGVFNELIEDTNEDTNEHTEEAAHNENTVNEVDPANEIEYAHTVEHTNEDTEGHTVSYVATIKEYLENRIKELLENVPAPPAHIVARIEKSYPVMNSNALTLEKTTSLETTSLRTRYENEVLSRPAYKELIGGLECTNDQEIEAKFLVEDMIDDMVMMLSKREGSEEYNALLDQCNKKCDTLASKGHYWSRDTIFKESMSLANYLKTRECFKYDIAYESITFVVAQASCTYAEKMVA